MLEVPAETFQSFQIMQLIVNLGWQGKILWVNILRERCRPKGILSNGKLSRQRNFLLPLCFLIISNYISVFHSLLNFLPEGDTLLDDFMRGDAAYPLDLETKIFTSTTSAKGVWWAGKLLGFYGFLHKISLQAWLMFPHRQLLFLQDI